MHKAQKKLFQPQIPDGKSELDQIFGPSSAMRPIFDSMALAILGVAADGQIMYLNSQAKQLLGIEAKTNPVSIWDLVLSKNARKTLAHQFKRRAEGFSDDYE